MSATWRWAWSRNLRIRYLLCILYVLLILQLNSGPKTISLKPALRELVKQSLKTKEANREYAQHDIGIVMAKTGLENVNWLLELYSDMPFRPFIYSMKSIVEPGCLKPHSRRGRETAPYLSYIIDNYASLPDYSIFIHSKPEQWHNDILGKSTHTMSKLSGSNTLIPLALSTSAAI